MHHRYRYQMCKKCMVRKDPLNEPERYIRNHKEMLKSTDKIHLSSEVPVIDLSQLSNANEDELELNKPDLACKERGFFQVLNHAWSPKGSAAAHKGYCNRIL
ncbi:hypothetical protein LguiA_032168 [Lonicera macranthoides]